ncbi:MAG: RidA family protein [Hyphomicrobiales bacterium]|nr:RidA family protein [Hyphomicrobiales bacterium]MDE2285805.1 RidA family protein [Hyphomicrobiales bacterium]
MSVRYLNPQTIFKPPGYSHVVEVSGPGRTIYIAGQVGIDRDRKIPPDGRGQMVLAFENLKAALAEAGASFKDVVKINNYLVEGATMQDFREVRDDYLNTAAPPASTTIFVSKLAIDGLLFEIEAVAVLPPK